MGELGEQHAEHAENDQTDKPKEKPVTTHDAFFLGGHGAWCKGRTAKTFPMAWLSALRRRAHLATAKDDWRGRAGDGLMFLPPK